MWILNGGSGNEEVKIEDTQGSSTVSMAVDMEQANMATMSCCAHGKHNH